MASLSLLSSSFSAIARSVMISAIAAATAFVSTIGFSAIARSVMISAIVAVRLRNFGLSFSAIARSVMISASSSRPSARPTTVSVL